MMMDNGDGSTTLPDMTTRKWDTEQFIFSPNGCRHEPTIPLANSRREHVRRDDRVEQQRDGYGGL